MSESVLVNTVGRCMFCNRYLASKRLSYDEMNEFAKFVGLEFLAIGERFKIGNKYVCSSCQIELHHVALSVNRESNT